MALYTVCEDTMPDYSTRKCPLLEEWKDRGHGYTSNGIFCHLGCTIRKIITEEDKYKTISNNCKLKWVETTDNNHLFIPITWEGDAFEYDDTIIYRKEFD